LNIQIFGTSKSFDSKKAERWFKERRIKYQYIDLVKYGMSGKEFDSVLRAVGGIDALIDWDGKSPEITLMKYMDDQRAKEDKVFEDPSLMKAPVVRNGKQATVGFKPEVWSTWE
jgi:arsenate reductase-like glutaredoxin family protein